MKPWSYISHFSSFGSFAAILVSLMPCPDSRAQDVQVQPPRGVTTAVSPTSNLAACSPDGESYAMATPDGRIKCGSTREGARSRTLQLCNPRVLVFSPDSRLLAAAGGSLGGAAKIKVWRVADGAMICKLDTEAGKNPLLSFSQDGSLLVSTAAGDGGSQMLSFSQDGSLLVSTGEGSRINVWQLPAGTLKSSFTTDRPVWRLAFSKEGKAVVALFAHGSVKHFPVP